tara:strand:- start:731 stop:1468 length:738 start_codon:yes stop_codon:yes gene_type:complete
MIDKIILLIIGIFDFFHKKKIINFLKNNNNYKFNTILDIGGHKGESIELFLKYFTVDKIISFEASPLNYKILRSNLNKFKKKFKKTEILIENLAAGNENKSLIINQLVESSSSTLKQINTNSNYFKKKYFFFKKNIDGNLFHKIDVKMILLEDYLIEKNIKNIDFLKIDTEGYEYETILGLRNKLKSVKLIFFEHHYDNMILKNYKFRDIHRVLVDNNFLQVLKVKMPLRKKVLNIFMKVKLYKF